MEPELRPPVEEAPPAATGPEADPVREPETPLGEMRIEGPERRDFQWLLFGPHGLRAGWSILLFAALYYLLRMVVGICFFAFGLVGEGSGDSAAAVLFGEMIPLLALVGATAVMGRVEGRRISSYNLDGPRRPRWFVSGAVAGFAALSLLVGALACGGWLHFGAVALTGVQAFRFAALWGGAFLVVAMVEEGIFRCYALFTLARGINFWWALAAQAAICLCLALDGRGQGAWGVYAAAAMGFFPCLILHRKAAPRSGGFWQAAWVTSSVFAFYHTSNGGENWIGIFAAALIGLVFCVSVRVTGSALWAIGCHAAWDWTETFFYGTADSGMQGQGHFLTANPAGNPLWSGGDDGPEGSLLVVGAILVLLAAVIVLNGRKNAESAATALPSQSA